MSIPTVTPPGWYPDGVTPGAVRWFDGAAWSEHTAPDPSLAQFAPPAAAPAASVAGASVGSTATQPGWGPAAEGPGRPVPSQDWGHQPAPANGPSSAVHWLLPVGRSWQSIAAGYVGLFALALWILGPVAIGLGVWAIKVGGQGGHGRGRAVFAILAGALASVLGVMLLLGTFG